MRKWGYSHRCTRQLYNHYVEPPNVSGASDDEQRSTGSCHIQSEGKPSRYSGDNNEDDSGILKYVVIKHPCAEAAPGDELNVLTLNAVGSGTTIENIQVYSTYDDGFEQPFHGLDIVYSWYPTNNVTFKGRIKNILNSSVTVDQGDVSIIEQTFGSMVLFSVSWDL